MVMPTAQAGLLAFAICGSFIASAPIPVLLLTGRVTGRTAALCAGGVVAAMVGFFAGSLSIGVVAGVITLLFPSLGGGMRGQGIPGHSTGLGSSAFNGGDQCGSRLSRGGACLAMATCKRVVTRSTGTSEFA